MLAQLVLAEILVNHQERSLHVIGALPSKFNFKLFITNTALVLSACATTPDTSPILNYQCDMGSSLSVKLRYVDVTVMRGGKSAIPRFERRVSGAFVTIAGGTELNLVAQKVASGFKVSDGYHTLWAKGDAAAWTVGRSTIEQCRLQR